MITGVRASGAMPWAPLVPPPSARQERRPARPSGAQARRVGLCREPAPSGQPLDRRRIGSRPCRLRTASSSGARRGERRIRLCASGSMAAGRPTAPAPRTAARTPARASAAGRRRRLAVPLRSSSRAGIEAVPAEREPHRRSFDADVLDGGHALGDLQVDASARRRACGRRENRRRPTAAGARAGAAIARH